MQINCTASLKFKFINYPPQVFYIKFAFAFGALSIGNKNLFKIFTDDPLKIIMHTYDTGVFTEKEVIIVFHFS